MLLSAFAPVGATHHNTPPPWCVSLIFVLRRWFSFDAAVYQTRLLFTRASACLASEAAMGTGSVLRRSEDSSMKAEHCRGERKKRE